MYHVQTWPEERNDRSRGLVLFNRAPRHTIQFQSIQFKPDQTGSV